MTTVERRIAKLLTLANDRAASEHERELARTTADRLIDEHNVIRIPGHPRYHWERYRSAPHTGQGKTWRKADDKLLVRLWIQRFVIADIATALRRSESQCFARIRNLKKNGKYQAVAAICTLPDYPKVRRANA